jgi:hypothetical protein
MCYVLFENEVPDVKRKALYRFGMGSDDMAILAEGIFIFMDFGMVAIALATDHQSLVLRS